LIRRLWIPGESLLCWKVIIPWICTSSSGNHQLTLQERCSGPILQNRTGPSYTAVAYSYPPTLIETSLTSTSAGGQWCFGLAALAPARPRFSWVLASRALASQSPRRARPPMAVSYPRTAGVGASLAVPVTTLCQPNNVCTISGTTLVIAARADTHAQQGILARRCLSSLVHATFLCPDFNCGVMSDGCGGTVIAGVALRVVPVWQRFAVARLVLTGATQAATGPVHDCAA